MATLLIGAFLLIWIAFAFQGFRRKWSGTISIGGGFGAAVFGLLPLSYLLAFVIWIRNHSERFSFAVDQLGFLIFWLVADLVLLTVYPRLLAALWKIPLIGGYCGYLIAMPLFHAAAVVDGVLVGFGMSDNHALVGAGLFLLMAVIGLAYWIAVDNVRKGNFGMR